MKKSSIDEFYIDMSGMDRFFGCLQYATELRHKIIRETGLPISFGLSENKTVSKIATGEAKPNNQIKIEYGSEKIISGAIVCTKNSDGWIEDLSGIQKPRGKAD